MSRRIDEVEIVIVGESGTTIVPATGKTEGWEGLRVRFRFAGEPWRLFLLTGQVGYSLADLVDAALHVISLAERGTTGGQRELFPTAREAIA